MYVLANDCALAQVMMCQLPRNITATVIGIGGDIENNKNDLFLMPDRPAKSRL